MNSNGPRKKMITICSTLVAIGVISLIFSIYSKMSAQDSSNEGLTVFVIFSLVFTLASSLSLILILKNKDSRVEEIRSFGRTRYTMEIQMTKENAPIMKIIVSLVCGMLIVLIILFMDFPQDILKISNFFGFLQHNMVNILAICFLLTIWGVSFYSIDFYSDPEKQRYYNSAEYREQQMEKMYKFTENVQKFINYLKTLFHKNN